MPRLRELSDIPVLMTSWVKVVFHIYSLIYIKNLHMCSSPNYFSSQLLSPEEKYRTWHKQRSFSSQNKVAICWPALEATRPENYTNYKHPLINFIWLSVKEMVKHEGQINGEEKQSRVKVLCSKRARSCVDGVLGSSLQARAKLSWNKWGMTLLMKGGELTRIALAQCTRSLCQSKLQRYNKVHGYNEAWAHLSLNCGVFRRTESLSWNVYLLLLYFCFCALPFLFCTYHFGDDSNCCNAGFINQVILEAICVYSLEKKYNRTTMMEKKSPSFLSFCIFPVFQYADRCLQKSGLSPYDPRDVPFPEKQEHCSILSPTEWFYGNSLTIVGS